jgi:hypothetical protein
VLTRMMVAHKIRHLNQTHDPHELSHYLTLKLAYVTQHNI